MKRVLGIGALVILLIAIAPGCKKKAAAPGGETTEAAAEATADAPAEERAEEYKGYSTEDKQGVDLAGKAIIVGALNAETGPAAVIGKPYAIGKRILLSAVNDKKLDVLADGWQIQALEKDHGYNPQKSVQGYNEIKDRVLFITTSFGTPTTLPLLPHIERDNIIAFPASLSSQMAENAFTPPTAASYLMEAMRSMDWAVKHAGGADKVKAAIVYQQDDYGKDGLEGWRNAAKAHNVSIVSEQTVAPGQKDMTAIVTALQKAGANYILLTVLPSATGPILGTAFQLKYTPNWIGNTPSWIDAFFSGKVLPTPVLANFYWASSLPFWGEDVPGMDKFLEAFKAYADPDTSPDSYILASYIQGLIEMEALKRVFAAPEERLTREAFMKALQSIKDYDAGGFIQPVDLTQLPYVTSTKTRILKPDFEKKSWTVVADYASPSTLPESAKAPEKAKAPVVAAPAAGDKAAAGDASAAKPTDDGAAAPAATKDTEAPKTVDEGTAPPAAKGSETPKPTVATPTAEPAKAPQKPAEGAKE